VSREKVQEQAGRKELVNENHLLWGDATAPRPEGRTKRDLYPVCHRSLVEFYQNSENGHEKVFLSTPSMKSPS